MKKVYIIRHCEAAGQQPEAQLTDKGFEQAAELALSFSNTKIDRIISSPYKRTIQSVQPLAERLNVKIEINKQLTERVLSTKDLMDWLEKLKTTFEDLKLKFDDGESSQEATERIVKVVKEVFNGHSENTIIVTHGNLISLLLHYYDRKFGFDEWKSMSNPDVFLLKMENNKVNYERLWNQK